MLKSFFKAGFVVNAHNIVYLRNLYSLLCLKDNNMKTPVAQTLQAFHYLYKKAE